MDDFFYNELAKNIDEETDTQSKEIQALIYGLLIFMDYVKEVDPDMYKRGIEFMTETNQIKSIELINMLKKETDDDDLEDDTYG